MGEAADFTDPEKQNLLLHDHEEKHFMSSEVVRDIIIGVSDGLTVPFALAAGLSGADVTSSIILIAGIAEVAAGAISMGLGGYTTSHLCHFSPYKILIQFLLLAFSLYKCLYFGFNLTRVIPIFGQLARKFNKSNLLFSFYLTNEGTIERLHLIIYLSLSVCLKFQKWFEKQILLYKLVFSNEKIERKRKHSQKSLQWVI